METVSSPLDQKHLWVNLALLLILAQPQLPSGDRGSPTGGLCASPHGPRQASPSLSPTPVHLVSMEPHTADHSMVLYSRQLHFPGTLLFEAKHPWGKGPFRPASCPATALPWVEETISNPGGTSMEPPGRRHKTGPVLSLGSGP